MKENLLIFQTVERVGLIGVIFQMLDIE